MKLSKSTAGLALFAAGAGVALGHGLQPLLQDRTAASPGSFALVRYEGWLQLLWAHCVCVAAAAGIVRLGNNKSIGPNAQLQIFHDGNALVGVALAIALHGSGAAWPLGFAAAGKALVDACQALRLRRSVACALVWVFAAVALLLNNAFESASITFWCQTLLGNGAFGDSGTPTAAPWEPLAAALDRFTGVAPMHFTVGLTFRYMLMRYVSWAIDSLTGRTLVATRPGVIEHAYSDTSEAASPRIGAIGGKAAAAAAAFESLAALSGPDSPLKVHPVSTAALTSATWSAFLSYMLFPPLLLVGPLVRAADYYQQAAAASAGRRTTHKSLAGANWFRTLARLAGFVAFMEAIRRTFFTDGMVAQLLAAQPWQSWATAYCVLTALFAQNYVPWTSARLSAAVLGISAPDEAPVGFLTSSLTPRTFWRNFHVSWYCWLRDYVYIPLGASTSAVMVSLMVSTLLHGGHRAWLTWGAIQCTALLAERALERRKWAARLHPHLRTALVQCATQTTLLVQLPLGPSLPKFLACFHALNLPFCILNAARVAGQRRSADPGLMAAQRRSKAAAKLAWE